MLGAGLSSFLSLSSDAEATCVSSGSTITCTGDESGGIAYTNSPYEVLNVNSLTNDITPAGGVDGVRLTGDGGNGGNGGSEIGTGHDGHPGDDGKTVEINFDGTPFAIITSGASNGQGITATSRGGKGGEGGTGEDKVIDPFATKGGKGGKGGDASNVTVNSAGTITTTGQYAHGILAVSEAGDGGKGGHAEGAIDSEGGNGGQGGAAGDVFVNNAASINTDGNQALGIYAQSIGGSGGDGGSADGIFGGGGSGEGPGPAGSVSVTNSGVITTENDDGTGIMAQSVGGFAGNGGGDGGLFTYGGGAQSYGDAGNTVYVTNSGQITTQGTAAAAILAQSVGGGGGNAGTSVGLVALGGSGSAGGDGGVVEVTNTALLRTNQDYSDGILAQSVGGGGGNAGTSVGLVSIGGNGGSGGSGSTVTLYNRASISTLADHSNGILAQSLGKGGGKGGGAVAVGAEVSVAVGGKGGSGGNGGDVFLNSDVDQNSASTTITTAGDHSAAVMAQSVGGGGGRGGWAVSVSGGYIGDLSVGKGGEGGTGGDSGAVTLHNNGVVMTEGDYSDGIIAQSNAGGGGRGGFDVTVDASSSVSFGVGVGGGGGDGGDVVGAVNLNSWTDVTTAGDHSAGVFAQSAGGSGGHGGFSIVASGAADMAVSVSVAGGGGGGGDSNTVDLASTGNVSTSGDHSSAVLGQSTGGGGGNGGFSISASVSGSVSIPVSVGGGGGSGGHSGNVTVDSTGTLTTTGDHSHGFFAQSTGGGGGNGGFSIAFAGSNGANVPVTVGGGGAGGGFADTVDATNDGDITTSGNHSHGLFAQSVGGSGGNGGFSISGSVTGDEGVAFPVSVGGSGSSGEYGSAVTVGSSGDIQTSGVSSIGIFAQSVGGGGGHGGFSIEAGFVFGGDGGNIGVSVGGKGSSGADAGVVMVTNDGNVITGGDNSPGIQAQSVGGNGGNGGFSVSFNAASQSEIGVSVGGGAGSAGAGKAVTVDNTGTVYTTGKLAYGIQAQSLGGGGGNGGFSIAGDLTISGGDDTTADVSVSVGGGGGNGGASGTVDLTHTGSVFTEGDGAHAIFAQSLAGGGGAGGFSGSVNLAYQGDAQIGVSVGGGAGNGGTAEDVTVVASGGDIGTLRSGAVGIFAQSVGGGGGDGGFSFVGNIVGGNGDGPTTNIGVSVGGGGGDGGKSGNVSVTNDNFVETFGLESYGIQAQSLGGSGGNGGLSVSGDVVLTTSTPSNNLNVAVGGGGGSGNTAGDVEVINTGDILTVGGKARGIFAQSVGGDGGNGGLSFSGSLAGGGGSSPSPKDINVSVGGGGGSGNAAGTVMVTNSGNFETFGYQAQGIYAQSVGGSGGTGGMAGAAVLSPTGKGTNLNINVSIGGDGGGSGAGKAVTVINSGSITTHDVGSTGIIAQSLGGDGGVGGSSFAGIVGFTKPPGSGSDSNTRSLKVNVAIGGAAGDGAVAGAVVVDNSGAITTTEGSAKGIFAQSAGGSGGTGGASDTFSMLIGKCGVCSAPDLAEKSISLSVSVGGKGGTGGDGNTVNVTNTAMISTAGAGSDAIYAQSIGGGGGEGGNGSLGLKALIGTPGVVIDDIVDIVNPPIQFWKEIGVDVGGSGGAAGNGAAVTVGNAATLITTGDRSTGIFAQSVGGGGGQGGNAAGGAFSTLHIGGSGKAAGDAALVKVTNEGDIGTTGESSTAIFAQSIGGGGGVSGSVDQDFLGTGANFGIGIGISLGGGHGGNGGDVEVSNSATLITEGAGAFGIWAQSVGGGGGVVGDAGISITGLNFAGSAGDDGDAGDVTVTHTGDILTLGTGAAGIVAQSASGGENGNTDNLGWTTGAAADNYALGATGTGGLVQVSVNSSVVTEGKHSKAIIAQSVGLNGNGDITVTVGADGLIIGGTDMDGFETDNDPYGVLLLDGKTNLIKNSGLITTREGFSGTAIYAKASQSNDGTIFNTVTNHGIITGSVVLAEAGLTSKSMSSAFDNEITGLFNMGIKVDLGGSPNTLTNKGIVSPGGVNNILATELNGDYTQTGDGSYVVTVDYADNDPNPGNPNEADLINVSGKADLEGFVIVDAINGAFVGPDQSGKVLIMTSADEIGTATLIAPDTEVVTYDITYEMDNGTDPDKVFLEWIVDFTPDGLNRNETAVANYIIEAIDVGDPLAISPVINSLLEAPDLDSLRNDYDRLTPEPYIDNEIVTVLGNMQLGRALIDCPRPEEHQERDNGCFWLRGGAHQAEQSESFEYLGFDEFAYQIEGGIGGNISDTAGLVLGFSYSNSEIDTKGRFGTPDVANSSGDRYQGGIGISNTKNGTTFAVAALGGAAFYDVERNLELTDFSATAEGDQKLYFGGGQIRLAHEAKAGAFRFSPLFEAWGGYFHQQAISETGAEGANLDIESKDDYFLAIRPALTLALEWLSDDGAVFRPFISGGATYFALGNEDNGPSLTATMQGEENEVPGFTVNSALQDYYIDGMAGFTMKAPNGAALSVTGSAQYAEDYLSYGGSAKFSAPF